MAKQASYTCNIRTALDEMMQDQYVTELVLLLTSLPYATRRLPLCLLFIKYLRLVDVQIRICSTSQAVNTSSFLYPNWMPCPVTRQTAQHAALVWLIDDNFVDAWTQMS